MTSKEALNILYSIACIDAEYQRKEYITYAKEIEHNELVKKYFDITSQALESLEKENQKLKEQRLSLSLQLQDYKLIKEITLPNVLEENEKLKKAIKILKRVLLVNVKEVRGIYYAMGYDTNEHLTKEDYELLKEVLGDE